MNGCMSTALPTSKLMYIFDAAAVAAQSNSTCGSEQSSQNAALELAFQRANSDQSKNPTSAIYNDNGSGVSGPLSNYQ